MRRPGAARSRLVLGLAASLCAVAASPLLAHEVRPAYLELRRTGAEAYDVLWKVPARGDDLRLALDVEFPAGTIAATTPRMSITGGAATERWRIRRPGGLTGQQIHIAGLEATMTDVLVRIEELDGATQVAHLTPSSPSFVMAAAPDALAVTRTYLALGVEHILSGFDHLLFVLALLVLVRGWRKLVGTVTAFTVAHSITLAAATLGAVHVPSPPVEACIALSIVFVATEIVRGREGRPGLTERSPWVVAFTFGLLHGLGFAGALSQVGLPPNAIPFALLFFNVGVEIGQLAFVVTVLGLAALARRVSVPAPAWGWRVVPYAIGTLAMFLVFERLAAF